MEHKFAGAMGISEGTVSRWLNGKNINIGSIQELEKFGVSMHWLIYGTGKMMIKNNEKLENDNDFKNKIIKVLLDKLEGEKILFLKKISPVLVEELKHENKRRYSSRHFY